MELKIRKLEHEAKTIKLLIWVTADQERFKTITSSFCRDAHGIIIVGELSDKEADESATDNDVPKLAGDVDEGKAGANKQNRSVKQSKNVLFVICELDDHKAVNSDTYVVAGQAQTEDLGGQARTSTAEQFTQLMLSQSLMRKNTRTMRMRAASNPSKPSCSLSRAVSENG